LPQQPLGEYRMSLLLKTPPRLSPQDQLACLGDALDELDFEAAHPHDIDDDWARGDIRAVNARYRGSAVQRCLLRAPGAREIIDKEMDRATDRIWAALAQLDTRHDVIVNLQGDLPALDPAQLKAVVAALDKSGADIATLAAPIDNDADKTNPAVVKAVVAWDASGTLGRALYFTRATAPTGEGALFHHVGLYAYRREALESFVALPPSPLERREKLEQLRALEAGMTIAVARVDEAPLSVDTPDDLERARKLLS